MTKLSSPVRHALRATMFALAGAFVCYVCLKLGGVPFRLYPTDAFGIFAGSMLAAVFIYLGFSNAPITEGIAAVIVTALLGYIVESTHRLDDKDGVRLALIADISSTMELLQRIDVINLMERVTNPNAPSRLTNTVVSPQQGTKSDKPIFAWDFLFTPESTSDRGSRAPLRYVLEQLTTYSSQENYFNLWDQVARNVGDLPEGAIDPVARFYSTLRGSRDLARRFEEWRAHSYDPNDQDLLVEMNTMVTHEIQIVCALVTDGDEALVGLKDTKPQKFNDLKNAAKAAADAKAVACD